MASLTAYSLQMYNANPIKLNDEQVRDNAQVLCVPSPSPLALRFPRSTPPLNPPPQSHPLNRQYIRDVFTSIVKTLGMTQVALSSQAMSPQGVSAVSLLTESHMSVHTWPELGYAAFDVFTCGHTEPLDAVLYLAKAFDIKKPEVDLIWAYIDRGQDETDDDDVTRLISTLYASKVLVEKKESKYQESEKPGGREAASSPELRTPRSSLPNSLTLFARSRDLGDVPKISHRW